MDSADIAGLIFFAMLLLYLGFKAWLDR